MQVSTVRTLLLEAPLTSGLPAHVAAASGLARVGDWLHVVPDDSLQLATFALTGDKPGSAHQLFADAPLPEDEKERKRLKPDLESLTVIPFERGRALLAVGSGSTANRCRGVLQPLMSDGAVQGAAQVFDLTKLYASLPFAQLNIEGIACLGDRLFLGQRGNSAEGINALIELDFAKALQALTAGQSWGDGLIVGQRRLDLGALQGVRLTLTDLSSWGDRLLFSAAAEDTDNPYDDGQVIGSVLGWTDLSGGETHLASLDGLWKVEGVEALDDGRVLMVTDGDDPKLPAVLLEARDVQF